MNPQQYPPQSGQTPPGYPGQPGQPGPYPPQQPGPYNTTPQATVQPQQPAAPPNGYNPYAYQGEYDKPVKKGLNKVVVFGGIALLLVIVIIGAIAASSSSNQGTATQTEIQGETTGNGGKDVIDRSDATLDLSQRIISSETLKAQTIKAKTGQQINLSSGFSFMVTKVESYVSANPATLPADGKQFIAVTTVIGNRNEGTNQPVSYQDFRLRNASNQLLAPSASTNEVISNPLASPSEIKPGQQLTGVVIYEVDADETTWVFKRTETYQKTTDNTTFTVEGEISIQLGSGSTPSDDTSLSEGAAQGDLQSPASP